jgi:ligand-binding SRPBCC domain-containing protein
MDFTITSEPTDEIYEGMIITYCVKIIPPISTVWVSEITHVQAPHFFVDEQRHGPYRFWHHQHILEEKGNGVLMQDIVHYSLPIPIVGRIMNFFYIRHKLEEIFTYRRNTLKTIFGKSAEEKD